jgi:Activator of Hsp90 ATPase homolog 1-like protein
MMDIPSQIGAIGRAVAAPATASEVPSVSVTVNRRYPAPVEDVWDAIVDPDRLRRWFMPISGDLRVGGTFQLEGNAGGSILACETATALDASLKQFAPDLYQG